MQPIFSAIKTISFSLILSLCLIISAKAAENQEYQTSAATKRVEEILQQMVNALNGRSLYEIEKFFKYHCDKDATFIKKVITIEDEQEDFRVNEVKLSLDEYIDYLKALYREIYSYSLSYKINTIDIAQSAQVITANVSFDEYAQYYVYQQDGDQAKESKLASNCTYLFLQYSDSPKLLSSNCIEKIINK